VSIALSDLGGGATKERVIRSIQAGVIKGHMDFHDGWMVDRDSLATWLETERERIANGQRRVGRPPIIGQTQRYPFIKV